MTNDELLHELESLVEAIEDCFTTMTGAMCETGKSGEVLKNLAASKTSLDVNHGPNGWRDRILTKMLQIAALKSRRLDATDQDVQSLVARILGDSKPPAKH